MSRALKIAACRQLCDWSPTQTRYGGEPVFACRGCGSQWVRSEPWTPAQADGTVPDVVRQERQRG